MSNKRRQFLKAAAVAGATSLAGCQQQDTSDTTTTTQSDQTTVSQQTTEADVTYDPVGPFEWMSWSRGDNLTLHLNSRVQGKQMERLGFTINYKTQSVSTLVDRLINRNYTIFNSAFIGDMSDGDLLFRLSGFASSTRGDGLNYSEFSSSEYDELFNTYKGIIDFGPRTEAAKECAKFNAQYQPYIWSSAPDVLSATNSNHFTGWKPGPFDWPMMTFDNFNSIEPVGDRSQVVMAATLEPSQINVMSLTDGFHNKILSMMYHDHLVFIDSNFEPVPWAAKDWEVVDPTTMRFTLREGMTFHDGEPMTAEDVAFTYDYLQEYKVPYIVSFYESVENATAVDEHTVEFTFKQPDGAFIPSGLPQTPILPKHIWDGVVEEEGLEHPRQWSDDKALVGGGPFKIDNVEQGSFIKLSTFDDHHSADFSFDSLIWNVYGSSSTAVGDLENDNASFMMNLNSTQFDRLSQASNVETHNVPGFSAECAILPAGASDAWGDQATIRPWIDPAFHLAAAWATDKEELVNVVHRGRGTPAHSVSPEAHVQGPATEELPVAPGGNLQKAKQILIDAGYRWNDTGQLMMPRDRLDEIEQAQLDGSFSHAEYVPDSAY